MTIRLECDNCGTHYKTRDERAGRRVRCKVCGRVIRVPELDQGEDANELERSPSGSPIYRHKARTRPFEPAIGESETIEAISGHIAAHIGPAAHVFHEIASDFVHVDLHCVPPGEDRPYQTLVTSGMSDRSMNVPRGAEELRFAELMLCLPPDWPLEQGQLKDEVNYWPLRLLKMLARFPHEYDTWLAYGHTIPNGDPPAPYAENTQLCCALLALPLLAPEDFLELVIDGAKTIRFYSLVPLYREEMEFKLQNGMDALGELLAEYGVTELLDIQRRDVCKSRR
jgi:predicted Zn finger-like uncharacterized protein